jgi:putative transposase
VIDQLGLRQLCGFSDPEHFAEQYRQWVYDTIVNGRNQRESCRTESIAVGSASFIDETKSKLGIKASGRRIEEQQEDRFVLREVPEPYGADYYPQKGLLRSENSYYRDISDIDSIG